MMRIGKVRLSSVAVYVVCNVYVCMLCIMHCVYMAVCVYIYMYVSIYIYIYREREREKERERNK